MYFNPSKVSLAALGLVASAHAHTVFTNFYVDGQNQGLGTCVRMDRKGETSSFPIGDITGPDMACGRDGQIGVDRVCPVKAGAKVTFEFHPDADDPTSGVIAESHKGPCAVYMKKVESALASNNAAGDGWFKIWEDSSVDEATESWCTTRLIQNNGLLSVNVPADIESGYYLLRPELLALHSAKSENDPQFYIGCGQIHVEGTGTARPKTVSIPQGYVDKSTPAMTYDIWTKPLSLPFPMYGPKPYEGGGGSAAPAAPDSGSEEQCDSDLEGQKPEGCILEVGNWCGFEVPSYTDVNSCWDSSQKCWDQSQACWDTKVPASWKGCKVWQQKCEVIADNCGNKVFPGPPNAGKVLTPPTDSLSAARAKKRMALVKKHETHALRHARRSRPE